MSPNEIRRRRESVTWYVTPHKCADAAAARSDIAAIRSSCHKPNDTNYLRRAT